MICDHLTKAMSSERLYAALDTNLGDLKQHSQSQLGKKAKQNQKRRINAKRSGRADNEPPGHVSDGQPSNTNMDEFKPNSEEVRMSISTKLTATWILI